MSETSTNDKAAMTWAILVIQRDDILSQNVAWSCRHARAPLSPAQSGKSRGTDRVCKAEKRKGEQRRRQFCGSLLLKNISWICSSVVWSVPFETSLTKLSRMQNDDGVTKAMSATVASNSAAEADKQDATLMSDLRQAAHEYQERNGQHHPIAEFLYQLTKMLTDDNSEIIEWAEGRIRVHHPERLESEVLHKYFRHSKFASFQRQLNYFGFRKIAGKGKMSPCSYVNDAATSDIRSLLLIKRKTNGSAARKAAMQQRAAALVSGVNPALAGMNLQALASAAGQPLAVLNNPALASAVALLQENALRAGLGQLPFQQQNALSSAHLGLLALQHQHQLQELQKQQLQATQTSDARESAAEAARGQQHLLAQGCQEQVGASKGVLSPAPVSSSSGAPTIEQIQAHLAALSGSGGANANSLNLAASMSAAASLTGKLAAAAAAQNNNDAAASASLNPASAALKAQTASMPATAAMDAASATAQTSANLFDSAANLKSLLNEHSSNLNASSSTMDANNVAGRPGFPSSVLLNRLPSSNTIFPENSVVSLANMLGSSNRVSSLLSLNSFSREASLADLAASSNVGAHLAAAGSALADAAKLRSPNP